MDRGVRAPIFIGERIPDFLALVASSRQAVSRRAWCARVSETKPVVEIEQANQEERQVDLLAQQISSFGGIEPLAQNAINRREKGKTQNKGVGEPAPLPTNSKGGQ